MEFKLTKPLEILQPLAPLGVAGGPREGGANFEDILSSAVDNIKTAQGNAAGQIASWMNGEQTDIHQVAMSIQKAGLTFEVAMEVRNKMMQAYQEVMRMQI